MPLKVARERESVSAADATVHSGAVALAGELTIPSGARGIVVFAHGSGSSRRSARNRCVAGVLNGGRLATLLFDLLTAAEHEVDQRTSELRFDIELLTERLIGAIDWVRSEPRTAALRLGLFGASTGAAAALNAAAERPGEVAAVVSRGGRPDLAPSALPRVRAPTLLIVGGLDGPVIDMNHSAAERLTAPWQIEIVPGATHLFEEPDKLERVAALARDWFVRYL